MTTATRFSRNTVLERLDERIAQLEKEHGFKQGWGYACVEGRPTAVIVDFGRYEELLDLREEWTA